MSAQRPARRRVAWLWPLATAVVMLAAAAALYAAGLWALVDGYDGLVTFFNAGTVIAWCAASVLLLSTLPVAMLVREATREV
ncbi:hypothetical protein AB0M46_50090 [Dactylosporangium sp. NPDC051485]|uniref:hypothetical protein n=1 Tax=Dactylosporangium sp. NPDC051485 TaxID=3154846 RepID=UPI00341488EA